MPEAILVFQNALRNGVLRILLLENACQEKNGPMRNPFENSHDAFEKIPPNTLNGQ